MRVQHGIQAPRLILIAINPVLDLLRRIAREVVALALHGPHAGVLEEEPVVDLVGLAGAAGVRDLVLGVVLLDEVLLDGAGFEEVDGLPVAEGVGQCWDAAVGVDG